MKEVRVICLVKKKGTILHVTFLKLIHHIIHSQILSTSSIVKTRFFTEIVKLRLTLYLIEIFYLNFLQVNIERLKSILNRKV